MKTENHATKRLACGLKLFGRGYDDHYLSRTTEGRVVIVNRITPTGWLILALMIFSTLVSGWGITHYILAFWGK